MKTILTAILIASSSAFAVEIPVQQVADDAKVIDRVAQAAKRDLPQDLLKRILNEDIEGLRGKHADGTYDYATFERLEAGRSSSSYSVEPRKDDTARSYEMRGSFVYRLNIESPSRRMLVTKNRRVFIDHVDVEYIPMANSSTKTQTVKVGEWLEPGQSRPVDFAEVARQATVRVYAKGDPAAGYGNIDLTLVQAKIVDNADSPYADAVASAKAIQRAVDNNDVPSIRAMATRMHDDLARMLPKTSVVDVVAVKPPVTPPATVTAAAPPQTAPASPSAMTPNVEIYTDLQTIEDLLTGTEAEKREGLDRLHQLVRKFRSR
jgi:hypothetical protein